MTEMKQTRTANKQGCSMMLIFAISVIWIIGVSVVAQLMTWLMEQTIFEAAILFPDLRWLINAAYSSLIALPLFMLVFLFSDRMLKQIFRFWALLGALGFLMIPARFVNISDSVLIAIGQLGAIVVFGLLLLFLARNNQEQVKFMWGNEPRVIGVVLIFLAILIIPWVLWGALGSALDIVLHSLVAFSGSVLLIHLFLYQFYRLAGTKEQFEAGNIFRGLVLFTGLIIFSTVLGQSGQQLLLFFILPFSSWIIIRLLETSSLKPISAILFFSGLISFPLTWIDADELSLITSSGTGELIYWVNRSVITTVILLLILTAITGIFSHSILKIKKTAFFITVPVVWMIVIMIYFTVGQPGFFGESMFVILKDQADISFVTSIETYPERRSTTYLKLTEHANETQKDIRQQLDRYHISYTPYYLVNAIEVKAGPLVRLYLSSRPEVDRILDNPYLRPLPEEIPISEGDFPKPSELAWNIKMIEADSVWSTYGITGEGIVIGQSDSGVDGRHPAIKDKYAGINGKMNAWFDPWYHSTVPQDFGGHGTHTLGTILGDHIGVAPGAEWIGCVNLARNLGNPVYYLDCMQFMLAPYPPQGNSFVDGDPIAGAHVLNNSWGCPEIEGCDVDVYLDAVKALRAAGVFVVSSVGNSGYYGCESVTDPIAIYDDVTSVGAINEDGFLSSFSSLGPVVVDDSGRIKPDLVAPGEEILSAMPNGTYAKLSGTSMAGPHVVGVVALMWSANPELIGNVELTEQILFETTSPFEGILPACIGINKHPNNAVGHGVVNAQRAVEEALKIR